MSAPKAPVRELPPSNWPHLALHQRVRDALAAMPSHFRPDVHITGLSAPNLHTLNTPLGATIEEQATAGDRPARHGPRALPRWARKWGFEGIFR